MLAICEKSLALAIAGDRDEAEDLFRIAAPHLRKRISTHFPDGLRPHVDVEDVLQETLTEAFIDIADCQAVCGNSFFAWLFRIAANNLADLQRGLLAACRDIRRTHARSAGDDPLERLAWDLVAGNETPSWSAQRSELGQKLRAAIDELPTAYRTVVVQYDLQQHPIESICQRFDCSTGAIYMRRQRAHRMLRQVLESFSLYA